MKKSRFNEEQIIGILKEHEAGKKVADLAREHGISEGTFYSWKSKYGGLDVSEAQRLKALDDENRRLKHLVADLSLDKEMLKAVIRKKRLELAGLRMDVALVREQFHVSERRACKLLGMDRSTYRYEPRPDHNALLRETLMELARQKASVRIPAPARSAGETGAGSQRDARIPALPGGGPGRAPAKEEEADPAGSKDAVARSLEPGVGAGLRSGHAGHGPRDSSAGGGGRLYPRVSRTGSRYQPE